MKYFFARLAAILVSDHEWQVNILDAITDVDRAIDGRIAPVESIVAGPKLGSKSCNSFCSVLDDAPAEVWFISTDIVEESVRENGLLARNQILLLLVFNLTEVNPTIQVECLLVIETSKCLVDANLIKRGELEGTSGYSRTGAINLLNSCSKSIELRQMLGWQDNASCSVNHLRWLI